MVASTEPGTGTVELMDNNVAPGEMVKTPTSDLRVVVPASLELNCLPHKSWTVMEGTDITITVTVLDADNNIIHSSDNLRMEVSVDSQYMQVTERLSNGSLISGVPLKPGTVEVTAKLLGAGSCDLSSAVTVTARLEIVPRLSLQPQETFLPWDPLTLTDHLVKHRLVGGVKGGVAWSTTNSSLATTTQGGVTTVSGADLGESLVVAQLTRHKHCQAVARVEVVPATGLKLMESEQEFLVGESLQVPVQMTFSDGAVSACSLPLQLVHTEPLFTASLGPGEEGCASVAVTSEKVSHSKLTVTWSYPSLTGQRVTLTDSKYLATFQPLRPVWPASGETVLGVGTEREVEWVGGPLPWPLQPSSHYAQVRTGDQSVLTTARVSSSRGYVWRVECLTAGETELVLTVGNSPSSSLPSPVSVSSSVKVTCSVPHTISISPVIPGPDLPTIPPCPVQARQGRLAAQAYRDLRLAVSIKDRDSREIDSVKGVKVEWKVSDSSLGQVEGEGVLQDRDNSPHQILTVRNKAGAVDITATISRQGGLLGSSSHSDTAKINLVEDARVSPSNLDLFVLEAGTAGASHGSGYFTVISERKVVTASYSSSNSSITISPVTTGQASLQLVDLCLSARTEARLQVSVAGVDRVVLHNDDKVQLGETITASVKMMDSSGRSLPLSALEHVEVGVKSDVSLVRVEEGKGPEFGVTGLSLGQVQLTGSVSYSGRELSSPPQSVTVFPPLLLEPRNISLIIGASFQFTHTGGPSDCSITFTVADVGLAKTSQEALVTSLALGSTRLTATAVDSEGKVFSSDTVEVHIRPLTSVQLMVPSTTVMADTRLPVYLYGQDQDMNVYSYGSSLPLLHIDWSVSLSPRPGLSSPLAPLGHALVSDNSGVVVFSASSPGRYTVKATVTITSRMEEPGQYQLDRDKSLTVSTTITVIESLRITNLEEEAAGGRLLLSPRSKFQLRSNKAAVYSVQDSSLVTVSQAGLVKSSSRTGSTLVTAKTEQEEVAVVVEVRQVDYLLVEARSGGDKWVGDQLETVPRGGKLELVVSRHDKFGREFDDSAGELSHRPSRFDLVKLTGQTGTTVGPGWTVVRLWDKSGEEAWLNLRVGEAVQGLTSLTVGDVADYDSHVVGEGRWESDSSILDIETGTGVVVARRAGTARVRFVTTSGESVFSRQVTVGRSDQVTVETSKVISGDGARSVVKVVLGNGNKNSNLRSEGSVSLPSLSLSSPPFSCEASWDLEVSLASLFSVSSEWTGDSWACVFTRLSPAPPVPATISLTVLGTSHSLRFLPAISVSQTSLEVGETGSVIRVSGDPAVLDLLQTRHSEGLQLGTAWLEGEELHLPVSLTANHYAGHPTVTLSVPASGQSITVTVLPTISSTCGPPTGFLSALAANLIKYYQTVISIVLAALLAVYITKTQLSKTSLASKPAPSSTTAPTAPQSPEKVGDTSQNASSPYLWTVDPNPIYGSPIYR